MDKVENWITWILMAALLYKVSQDSAPACNTTAGTGWGVTSGLASGVVGNQLTSGLAGFRSLSGSVDCGCGGACGGCA